MKSISSFQPFVKNVSKYTMEHDPTRIYKYTVISSKLKTGSLEDKLSALNKVVTTVVNINNNGESKCSLVGGITFAHENTGIQAYQAILISYPKSADGELRKNKTRKSKPL